RSAGVAYTEAAPRPKRLVRRTCIMREHMNSLPIKLVHRGLDIDRLGQWGIMDSRMVESFQIFRESFYSTHSTCSCSWRRRTIGSMLEEGTNAVLCVTDKDYIRDRRNCSRLPGRRLCRTKNKGLRPLI